MKSFKADLHVHTCLSSCADFDMSPKGIIENYTYFLIESSSFNELRMALQSESGRRIKEISD